MSHSRIRVTASLVWSSENVLDFGSGFKMLNPPYSGNHLAKDMVCWETWFLLLEPLLLCRPWFLLGFPLFLLVTRRPFLLTKPPSLLSRPFPGEEGRQDTPWGGFAGGMVVIVSPWRPRHQTWQWEGLVRNPWTRWAFWRTRRMFHSHFWYLLLWEGNGLLFWLPHIMESWYLSPRRELSGAPQSP